MNQEYKGRIVVDEQNKDKFFPHTYADEVYFPDGTTLQDKYLADTLIDISDKLKMNVIENSNQSYQIQFLLGDQEIITPNLLVDNQGYYRKTLVLRDWELQEDGTYLCHIPKDEHHFLYPYVSCVYEENTETFEAVDITSSVQITAYDTAELVIRANTAFIGTVYVRNMYPPIETPDYTRQIELNEIKQRVDSLEALDYAGRYDQLNIEIVDLMRRIRDLEGTVSASIDNVLKELKEQLQQLLDSLNVESLATKTDLDTLQMQINMLKNTVRELQEAISKIDFSKLANVAFSGDYNDLENLPQLPTKLSDLINDLGIASDAELKRLQQVVTDLQNTVTTLQGTIDELKSSIQEELNKKANTSDLAAVATSGDYNDLQNVPVIEGGPTKVSQLENDAGYLTNKDITKELLLDMIHPVGSIYITVENISPSEIFGGTWTQIAEGTTLISQGINYTAGQTYGDKQHTITQEEMPAHTHTFITESSGDHRHHTSDTFYHIGFDVTNGGDGKQYGADRRLAMGDNPGYQNMDWEAWTTTDGNHIHNGTTDSTGDGQAFSLLQPSLATYIWKRTK